MPPPTQSWRKFRSTTKGRLVSLPSLVILGADAVARRGCVRVDHPRAGAADVALIVRHLGLEDRTAAERQSPRPSILRRLPRSQSSKTTSGLARAAAFSDFAAEHSRNVNPGSSMIRFRRVPGRSRWSSPTAFSSQPASVTSTSASDPFVKVKLITVAGRPESSASSGMNGE